MRPPRDIGWRLDPRLADDTHPVSTLGLSELRLMDDANHPWLILVPRIEHAVEWIDLDSVQQAELTRSSSFISTSLHGTGTTLPGRVRCGATPPPCPTSPSCWCSGYNSCKRR